MAIIDRTAISALSLSASALVGIALHEGYTDNAVQPLPGDKWTYGFGTTEGVKKGDRISPDKALARLLRDANKFEQAVKRCAPVPMHMYEYSAYVSLTYNIGETAFCKSTLAKKLIAYDYEGACKEILRWNMYKGSVSKGLDNRRKEEYNMCIGK